jgi:hypothetical protein
MVGAGDMRYMWFDLYHAELYAPKGYYKKGTPTALKLTYKRHLNGKKIADVSKQEIARLVKPTPPDLKNWHSAMQTFFPDVENGTTLTGIFIPGKPATFYRDRKKIGQITDAAFGPAFLDIWLAPATRAPDLRRKLLGQTGTTK